MRPRQRDLASITTEPFYLRSDAADIIIVVASRTRRQNDNLVYRVPQTETKGWHPSDKLRDQLAWHVKGDRMITCAMPDLGMVPTRSKADAKR